VNSNEANDEKFTPDGIELHAFIAHAQRENFYVHYKAEKYSQTLITTEI